MPDRLLRWGRTGPPLGYRGWAGVCWAVRAGKGHRQMETNRPGRQGAAGGPSPVLPAVPYPGLRVRTPSLLPPGHPIPLPRDQGFL